jgi:hypothetical protein
MAKKSIGSTAGKNPQKTIDLKKEQLARNTGSVPRKRKGAVVRKPSVSVKSRLSKYKPSK